VLRDLDVEVMEERRFRLANGERVTRPIGQTWVKVDGRESITMVVFGDEGTISLLGAVTLEEMGLGVDPVAQRLIEVDSYLL
jgi:predicted aspartyl protease